MRQDYSYEYEWDREYCYPNSDVLINKLNITDHDTLNSAERELTSLKLAFSKKKLIKGSFDLKHLQRIHSFVFGDIYAWAGQLRHVNISKGNQFCLSQYLKSYSDDLFGKLRRENYLIDSENVPERLAFYLSEINVLHPFREGNGRTQRLFIEYLASVAGYRVDFSSVTSREMIVASADSFAKEYDAINGMFERIAIPISQDEQRENITFFFGEDSSQLELFESESDTENFGQSMM